MKTETYNGWTNYATWRINSEMIDTDYWIETLMGSDLDTYELSNEVRHYVEELLYETGEGLVLDYAMAFIDDVNWYEIAEHIITEVE